MDWYSPKHVERILKMKSNHKNSVHLAGLYTYCKMMHGAYNVKRPKIFSNILYIMVLLSYLKSTFLISFFWQFEKSAFSELHE